ncbi:MAG: hypothetical protein JWR85_3821 [Marmoricola sp.]|nr:hypothetical protein [Marmoricola sp.]
MMKIMNPVISGRHVSTCADTRQDTERDTLRKGWVVAMVSKIGKFGRSKRASRVGVIVVSRGQFKKLMADDTKDVAPRELRELVLKDRAAARAR